MHICRTSCRHRFHSAAAAQSDLALSTRGASRTRSSRVGLGRLKAGGTRGQAQAEMEGVFAQVRSEQPDFNTGWTINLVPLREQLVGDVRLAGLVLVGAVGA